MDMDKYWHITLPQRYADMTATELVEYVTINFRNLGVPWIEGFLRELNMDKDPAYLLQVLNDKLYPGNPDASAKIQLIIMNLRKCTDLKAYNNLLDDLQKLERKQAKASWKEHLKQEALKQAELHKRFPGCNLLSFPKPFYKPPPNV